METIILFSPLIGALICGFGWKVIGEKAALKHAHPCCRRLVTHEVGSECPVDDHPLRSGVETSARTPARSVGIRGSVRDDGVARVAEGEPRCVCVHDRPATAEAALRAAAEVEHGARVHGHVSVPSALHDNVGGSQVPRLLEPLATTLVDLHQLAPLVRSQEGDDLVVCAQRYVDVGQVDHEVEVDTAAHDGVQRIKERHDHRPRPPLDQAPRLHEVNVWMLLCDPLQVIDHRALRLQIDVDQEEV